MFMDQTTAQLLHNSSYRHFLTTHFHTMSCHNLRIAHSLVSWWARTAMTFRVVSLAHLTQMREFALSLVE